MGFIYYETKRFIVRQWELTDIEALYQIMSNDKVHTFTGDIVWTKERAESYIRFMLEKDFRTLETYHGACILKDTNQLIGFTGLNPYLPKQPELEWQLGVTFWGNGYATEIGKASIENAFRATDITAIYGMANPENKASMRTLEKVGMKCLGLQEFRGHQDMFYKIDRV
jgi:RimJ/RimL family protein N-acetyltransferase